MNDAEDLAAFRAAVVDVQPLPPVDRVQLAKPKPMGVRLASPAPDQFKAAKPGKRRDAELPAHWQAEGPRRPSYTDPDQHAFHAAMAGVQPIASPNRVQLGGPTPPPRPKKFIEDERAALHESLHGLIALQDRLEGGDEAHYLRHGLAANVLRDLRRGRWVMQAELDLHGLNREDARHQLAHFLSECLHHGQRCVRIIHGKGHGSPQKLSILRQLVRGWLAQRQEILAYCQAQPHDGGEGALIVLLRAAKK